MAGLGDFLTCYDADAVVGQTITITFAYRRNYTITDAASPYHSYVSTFTVVEEISGSVSATRITDLAAAVGDDKWRIVTGRDALSGTTDRPLFDLLTVITDIFGADFSDTGMEWAGVTQTFTIAGTYTGTGAPPPDFTDLSTTEIPSASFYVDAVDQMNWNVAFGSGSASDAFTVDPFTLKKSGSDNFGFTTSTTVSNPGTITFFGDSYDVTAWDAGTDCTVAVI